MTGRFVIDYKITDDNLIYASYSRGYKSGGINPPLQPVFAVPESFKPEQVDAFEIGSRSEEHTSELQSLMRISYAVFCLKKKTMTHSSTQDITHSVLIT